MSNPLAISTDAATISPHRELQLKRLEMLQSVITRMAQNSFALKGWAVTLCSALLAFSAKDMDPAFALLAVLPATLFGCLDGYYLSLERKFRVKYEEVAGRVGSDMSLDLSPKRPDLRWWRAVCSRSVAPLYLSIIVIAIAIAERSAVAELLGR
jgi:hypothetical protein